MIRTYSYTDFVRLNWEEIKGRKFQQDEKTPEDNIKHIISLLDSIGIKCTEKFIDWRIYSLLLFEIITRKKLRMQSDWIPRRPDFLRLEECYNLWDSIKTDDVPHTFYNLKSCIEDKTLDPLSKLALLLRCKYRIHNEIKWTAYVPPYLSLYPRVLKIPEILNLLVTKNRSWGTISTIHYFPLSLAILEYEGFVDEFNWFSCSFLIISKMLNEDG